MKWDVFISHASEDNEEVARPLASLLTRAGLKVWLDENELKLGDSLRGKIDQGLAESRYGVVILSQAFFSKDWPQRELNGLANLESPNRKVILPIWHKIDHQFIAGYSPLLADKLAINTNKGLVQVANEILRVFGQSVTLSTSMIENNNTYGWSNMSSRRKLWAIGFALGMVVLAGVFFLYRSWSLSQVESQSRRQSAAENQTSVAEQTGITFHWNGVNTVSWYLYDASGKGLLSPEGPFRWFCDSGKTDTEDASPGNYIVKVQPIDFMPIDVSTFQPISIAVTAGSITHVEPPVGQITLQWNGSSIVAWYILDESGQKRLSPEGSFRLYCEPSQTATQDCAPGNYVVKLDAIGYQPVKVTVGNGEAAHVIKP
jgi:hypothetical protein